MVVARVELTGHQLRAVTKFEADCAAVIETEANLMPTGARAVARRLREVLGEKDYQITVLVEPEVLLEYPIDGPFT